MLTLYYKPSCPFCTRVLAVIDQLQLDVEMKDISSDESAAQELIAKGGKQQVPFLEDTEKGVAIYESDDVVAHLQTNYGNATASKRPRVHVGGETCVSCEG